MHVFIVSAIRSVFYGTLVISIHFKNYDLVSAPAIGTELDDDVVYSADDVPAERWISYLVPEGTTLRWFPCNERIRSAIATA